MRRASHPRPRPVLIYGIVLAVLSALSESADAANLLPGRVFPWIRLALTVAAAIGGAVWAQSKVTPLSDPVAADGTTPLIPDPSAGGSRLYRGPLG